MARDPAFLFYSQDFFTGVAVLNWEERGKFITILCLMHQQGRMNEETIRFIVGSVSDNLKAKFKIDEYGRWFNERLEFETEKRNQFTESRRNNGSLGGRPKTEKPNGKPKDNLKVKHMDNHKGNLMGNENEIVNENKDNIEMDTQIQTELITEVEILQPEKSVLQTAIEKKYPNICKLKNQLTFEQAERLIAEFPKDKIKSILEAMENYKDLPKKYVSVNLTIRNWLKRDLANGKGVSRAEVINNIAAEAIRNIKTD